MKITIGEEPKYMELPFDVHFERHGRDEFTMTVSNNKEGLSMRDCMRLVMIKEIWDDLGPVAYHNQEP